MYAWVQQKNMQAHTKGGKGNIQARGDMGEEESIVLLDHTL